MNFNLHFTNSIQAGFLLNCIVWIKQVWPGLYNSKSLSLLKNSCLVFCICLSNKKHKWKMQTGSYLLTHLRPESKSINAIVPFWNEMYLMHYRQQASLCKVISKLSRRGCWVFFPSLNAFHNARQTDRESLRVESMKLWHL